MSFVLAARKNYKGAGVGFSELRFVTLTSNSAVRAAPRPTGTLRVGTFGCCLRFEPGIVYVVG